MPLNRDRNRNREDERKIAERVEAFERAIAERNHADGDIDAAGFAPPETDSLYAATVCELVRVDMERRWTEGEPCSLNDYRARFPKLFADKRLVCEIAFEERRQRRLAGQDVSIQEYLVQLDINPNDWPSALLESRSPDVLHNQMLAAAAVYQSFRVSSPEGLEVDDLANSFRVASVPRGFADLFLEAFRRRPETADRIAGALTGLPESHQTFLGFRLLKELGRGAMGRVFLARQDELADRSVALKIAASVVEESQTLAQLQHPHIVPIHSIHRDGSLQAVCMPYLGSTTLADVIKEIQRHDSTPGSGRDLLSPIRGSRATAALELAAIDPRPEAETASGSGSGQDSLEESSLASKPSSWAFDLISNLDFVPAVLWIGARLADGLAFAHDKGIIHGDLKPANILMTDEGQPMLLDFNLATDLKVKSTAEAWVGGTLPYMAPERLQALLDRTGQADAQGDLYSLGVVLYELLTGRRPFPNHSGSPQEIASLMIRDRAGPPPGMRRWNRAITPAVKSIILRCLAADPAARYGTAQELYEDLTRQLEHRPLKYAAEPRSEKTKKWLRRRRAWGIGLAVAAGFAICLGTWKVRESNLRRTIARVEQTTADRLTRERLREALMNSRILLGDPLATMDAIKAELARSEAMLSRFHDPFDSSLCDDLGELTLLAARASARLATPQAPDREQRLKRAFDLNAWAETIYPRDAIPAAVWTQRARLAKSAGRPDNAKTWDAKADQRPPRSYRERYLTVLDQIEDAQSDQAHLNRALQFLREASSEDADNPQCWVLLGNLHRALSQSKRALDCYDTALKLDPNLIWARQNRGILQLEKQNFAKAIEDFSETIKLDRSLPFGWINRALARSALGQNREAIEDLTFALKLPDSPTRCWFLRAEEYAARKDWTRAAQDRAEGLKRTPNDEISWVGHGLAQLSQGIESPPQELERALADFEQALKLNPNSPDAWHNRGSVLAVLKRDQDAIFSLDQTLRICPNILQALLGRGVVEARSGMRDRAIQDAERALTLSDSADTMYQVACVYALTSRQCADDAAKAIDLLGRTLERKGEWLPIARTDPDLNPLRDLPEFQSLLKRNTPPGVK